MMSAQWARGNGGLYHYYRCTRKAGNCKEPYVLEKLVTDQCLEILRPLAISPDQANVIRAMIDAESEKESDGVERAVDGIADRIAAIQHKLNRPIQFVEGKRRRRMANSTQPIR